MSTTKIHGVRLWQGDALPDDAPVRKFAWMGISGSGKTYGAGRLVEELLRLQHQVVILDWVGNWHSIRLRADGKGPIAEWGHRVYVLGGEFGDIPIEPTSGAAVAEAIVSKRLSAVIDISEWSKAKRSQFACDFAERLLLEKRKDRSPLHLVIEEAQAFVPQNPKPGEQRLLGAFEELIKVGRNRGIGSSLLTQRPQALNKEALNQAEVLFIFRLIAAHERKAVNDWIKTQDSTEKSIDSLLPTLETGSAVVWSPSWLKKREVERILPKRTFDGSATPTTVDAAAPAAVQLSKEDLDALRAALTAGGETKAEKAKRGKSATAPDPDVVALRHQLEVARGEIAAVHDRWSAWAVQTILELKKAIDVAFARPLPNQAPKRVTPPATVEEARKHIQRPIKPSGWRGEASRRPAPAQSQTNGALPGGAPTALLRELVRWNRPLTRPQLGTQAGYSHRSSTFSNGLTTLRSHSYIEETPAGFVATSAGRIAFGPAGTTPPRDPAELVAAWKEKIPGGAPRAIFSVLTNVSPRVLSRLELGDRAGYSHTSSTFSNAITTLSVNGLIEKSGNGLRASPWLFMEQGGSEN